MNEISKPNYVFIWVVSKDYSSCGIIYGSSKFMIIYICNILALTIATYGIQERFFESVQTY